MNIHFQQVGKKPKVFSYILVAFAVFMASMLTLSLNRHAGLHLSIPSISMEAVHSENTHLPVAIPAPLPPSEQAQTIVTPEPSENSHAVFVPQAIAAPMPSVP